MKPSEWTRIAATIQERWHNVEIPIESIKRWGEDLADLEGQAVMAAVDALYREGRAFAPNGGEIRAKLVELVLDPPDWSTALAQLREIDRTPIERAIPDVAAYERGETEEVKVSYEYPRAPVLRSSHPLVVAFREHLGDEGLSPILHPDADGADEARARQKWDSFVRRAHEVAALRGIPDGGLRKLRRVSDPGELRKIGFADALPAEIEAA